VASFRHVRRTFEPAHAAPQPRGLVDDGRGSRPWARPRVLVDVPTVSATGGPRRGTAVLDRTRPVLADHDVENGRRKAAMPPPFDSPLAGRPTSPLTWLPAEPQLAVGRTGGPRRPGAPLAFFGLARHWKLARHGITWRGLAAGRRSGSGVLRLARLRTGPPPGGPVRGPLPVQGSRRPPAWDVSRGEVGRGTTMSCAHVSRPQWPPDFPTLPAGCRFRPSALAFRVGAGKNEGAGSATRGGTSPDAFEPPARPVPIRPSSEFPERFAMPRRTDARGPFRPVGGAGSEDGVGESWTARLTVARAVKLAAPSRTLGTTGGVPKMNVEGRAERPIAHLTALGSGPLASGMAFEGVRSWRGRRGSAKDRRPAARGRGPRRRSRIHGPARWSSTR